MNLYPDDWAPANNAQENAKTNVKVIFFIFNKLLVRKPSFASSLALPGPLVQCLHVGPGIAEMLLICRGEIMRAVELRTCAEEKIILPDVFFYQQVDGIIILGQLSNSYTQAVIDTKTPVVFLDFYNELTADSCVISDSFYGTYEMTNLLIRNGHRNIAFVGNIKTTSSIQDRYLGYLKSLIEHNIPIHDYYVLSDRNTETGEMENIELPLIMPTAFVCNCDETACRLINQLKDSGYRVPQDISVTGFDNSVYSTISSPNITTVEVNTDRMATIAVVALLEKIRTPSYEMGMIQVKGHIVAKESVMSINV